MLPQSHEGVKSRLVINKSSIEPSCGQHVRVEKKSAVSDRTFGTSSPEGSWQPDVPRTRGGVD